MNVFNSKKLLFTAATAAVFILGVSPLSRADSLFSVTTTGIKELNPNTGALINSFAAPYPPQSSGGDGLAFSGTALYYATIEVSTIYVLNPSSGAVVNSFAGPIAGIDALGYGSSSFGNTLFALDYTANRLYLLNPASGASFTSYLLGFDSVGGIDFDTARGTLFVSDLGGTIRELNPNNGAILNAFATGAFQTGLGFVGARLFTSAQSATTIQERNPSTGAILNSFSSPGGSAGGLAGSPVPEPSCLVLLGLGLAAVVLAPRCRFD